MAFDPYALPVPDLGLRCLRCGYNLAHLPRHRCPECGTEFDIESYIPPGDVPLVILNGEEVRITADIAELLRQYQIGFLQRAGPFDVYGAEVPLAGRGALAVPRERYFEVIDLLRRRACGESLPAVPPAREEEWTCDHCGEECPPNFELCWNCGEPGVPAA
ncbi:MAG: hypothetical protein DCC65_01090 [Planctomycetota bacterium]|nr:MAG: hypothetical protein DCC65_01090 [Planctomycetota bacterium]